MPAVDFNPRLGNVGRRMFYDTVTLSGGSGSTTVPILDVQCTFLSQSGAVAANEQLSAVLVPSVSNQRTTIAIDSSNGSSTVTCDVLVIGY